MVVDVLHHVNLDIIEVKELLDIVHLHVILVIFLIPQKDIQEELVLHLAYKVFQIIMLLLQLVKDKLLIVIIVLH